MDKKTYVVIWWDAFGNPHQTFAETQFTTGIKNHKIPHTNKMKKQEAETMASTMLPEQEAMIVLVCE